MIAGMMRFANASEETVNEDLIRNKMKGDPGYFAKTSFSMRHNGTKCNRKLFPSGLVLQRGFKTPSPPIWGAGRGEGAFTADLPSP